jgi:hypothetical protein
MNCPMCKNQMKEGCKINSEIGLCNSDETFECHKCKIVCLALWPQFENYWGLSDWRPIDRITFKKFEEVVRRMKLQAFN